MNPEHQAELEAQIDFTLMEEEGDFEPQMPPQWAWNYVVSLHPKGHEEEWLNTCNVAMLEIKETYLERLIKRLTAYMREQQNICEDPKCWDDNCANIREIFMWLKDYDG